jgi:hypothetical protein
LNGIHGVIHRFIHNRETAGAAGGREALSSCLFAARCSIIEHAVGNRREAAEMSDLLEASTLRAEIARSGVPAYKVAAAISLHPSRLSSLLRSEKPFPADVARRILTALKTNGNLVRS